jgi:NADH dehydrogenase FAD-containing subunit
VLLARLEQAGVEVRKGVRVREILPDAVLVLDDGGTETKIEADTVVLALGRTPVDALGRALAETPVKTYRIGDCVSPDNIMNAMSGAAIVAREV